MKFWAYAGFLAIVVFCLALDLGVFHREAHEVSMKEAATWSAIWVTLSLVFSVFVYHAYERHWLGLGLDTPMYNSASATNPDAPPIIRGEVRGLDAAEQYLVGYIVEFSLAMDNIFVIAMILSFFAVPGKYQHRVLFWGIVGAVLMRGGMIFLGAELVMRYSWSLIIFGAFLLLTAGKMALIRGTSDPSMNIVVRLAKKVLPLRDFHDGQNFFTRRTLPPTYARDPVSGELIQDPPPVGSLGRLAMTPLFLALLMVEVTDLIFAVDSIPAIFAITPDPFIVFTSNIFAILGLRSLYFCLAALISKFRFLKPALILILAFIGMKLLVLALPPYLDEIGRWFGAEIGPVKSIKIDTLTSLLVVVATLAGAIALSVALPSKADAAR
ncbi:MAG: TerC family protein [Phycisphaerae bacterium]|nr:TerC family protein [Phycisphaerae bacterium]